MYLRLHNSILIRWQNDSLCNGKPYPKVFDEIRKTLGEIKNRRFGKAPVNGKQVIEEFKKPTVMDAFGYSQLQDHGRIFNDVIISERFEYCVFSSAKSIALILENTEESERVFILDGTFRITPKGIWEQTLILQINFGIKVSSECFIKKSH